MSEQLLSYLFDDRPHPLSGPMGEWVGSSPRFKAFATTYRDKIRKKIRITQSDAGIKELEAELETAYWLLQEQRFALAYEPYSSQKTRGPDFAVNFKAITFNVEVTRIGAREGTGPEGTTMPWADPQQVAGRLMDTVCDKLGQMRPGMINVLVVVTGGDFIRLLDIGQAMATLKQRAERKDAGLFGRYGFVKPADFFHYYLRLSGIVVRTGRQEAEAISLLWANNQAKHAIPGPVRTILQRG